MSDNFALAFLGGEALAPTGRTLKEPSGSLLGSYGVIQIMSVGHKDVKARLDFHMFEVSHFDILIGHPIEKLLINLLESGSLSIRLGNESLTIPITRTTNIVAEISPIIESIEEVLDITPLDLTESLFEKDAEEFIQEEEDSDEVLTPRVRKTSMIPN
jgi:hypothetical protein